MMENDGKNVSAPSSDTVLISKNLYDSLAYLGIVDEFGVRQHNVGESDYAMSLIQPWTIWLAYPQLTSWDHDIIKRILRTKKEPTLTETQSRIKDYRKIIHICEERLRQLNYIKDDKLNH